MQCILTILNRSCLFKSLIKTFAATLGVCRTRKTPCRGRTTSPMGRPSASSTPSASCTTTLTSSSWVPVPHSSHDQLLAHYLAEYLPKCAQSEEKEVSYKFYKRWRDIFCPPFLYLAYLNDVAFFTRSRFIQKNARKLVGYSFRSARFEGLTSEVLLTWRFSNKKQNTPLYILVAFLASSVSTVNCIEIYSQFSKYMIRKRSTFIFVSVLCSIPMFAADPYTPSAEEVRDPELFAENVRKVTQ